MKRLALTLLLFLALATRANALILHVASTSAGSTDNNSVTTSAIDTTGATLIVVGLSYTASVATTPTDNKTNGTPTSLTEQSSGSNRFKFFYYDHPATVGSGHTFTASATGASPSIYVFAFSGVASAPFINENGNTVAAVTTGTTGSVTPDRDNCLLLAGTSFSSTATSVSINSSFTGLLQVTTVGAQRWGGAAAYKIQTTAGAENPAFSWTTNSGARLRIGSFAPATSSGAGAYYYYQQSMNRLFRPHLATIDTSYQLAP